MRNFSLVLRQYADDAREWPEEDGLESGRDGGDISIASVALIGEVNRDRRPVVYLCLEQGGSRPQPAFIEKGRSCRGV